MRLPDITLTNIAHEAAKMSKKSLAKRLLDKDTSVSMKIPVLIWMKEYESSLKEAFIGRDTNMINLVLIKFFTNASKQERLNMYQYVANISPELIKHVLIFLKSTHNMEFYMEFLDNVRTKEVENERFIISAFPIAETMIDPKSQTVDLLKNRLRELKRARDSYESQKDQQNQVVVENEMKVIEHSARTGGAVPPADFKVNLKF